MNIQEKKNYVKENVHFIPEEERQSFAFNFGVFLSLFFISLPILTHLFFIIK